GSTKVVDPPPGVKVFPKLTLTWPPSADLAPGEETRLAIFIQLPEQVEQRRYRLSARTTLALAETSWDLPASVTVGTGSIRAWSIIGPFPNTNDGGLRQVFPPEQETVADADYNGRRWRVLRSDDDRVDLG